jgi:hypothetical protein
VFYGSNLFKKHNPDWLFSNAAETMKVPAAVTYLPAAVGTPVGGTAAVAGRVCSGCGLCVSWLMGLPRRAGRRWYKVNDAEAGWRGWQVIERCGGLARQYRDARFDVLRRDPSLRRDELSGDQWVPGPAVPVRPECPCAGDQ